MPRKVRERAQGLLREGLHEIPGGKGSDRASLRPRYAGVVTVSGRASDNVHYDREKQVKRAIVHVQE